MNRPCVTCGEPSPDTRCPAHTVDTKPSATSRGYDHHWDALSRRARRMQPWCLHCGAVDDLQADHLPQAWERRNRGLPIRLADVQVLCGTCNRAAGNARPTGGRAQEAPKRPVGKANFLTDGKLPLTAGGG